MLLIFQNRPALTDLGTCGKPGIRVFCNVSSIAQKPRPRKDFSSRISKEFDPLLLQKEYLTVYAEQGFLFFCTSFVLYNSYVLI